MDRPSSNIAMTKLKFCDHATLLLEFRAMLFKVLSICIDTTDTKFKARYRLRYHLKASIVRKASSK